MLFSTYFSPLRACCLGIMLTFFVAAPCALASDMPGLGTSSSSDPDKGNVPEAVEGALTKLLNDIPATAPNPTRETLLPLLDFVISNPKASRVRPTKRAQGNGAFTSTTLNIPLQKVLRYCYDPAIPGEALYPNVLRRSYWLPGSEMLTNKEPLWDELGKLTDASPLRILRGTEFEEITPDTYSGCYYSYTLDRLIILLRYKERLMLVSVTQQKAPSNVGRVGAIVGKDNDWNYVYSKVVGSNIKLASWAETFMYDSANITVLFEPSPGAGTTQMAFFKYVRAGWANMNMVKASHITKGAKRFLEGLRQVLESPRLPKAEAIAAKVRTLRGMDEMALRQAMGAYSSGLAGHAKSGPLSSSNFKKLVQDGTYAQQLNNAEMGSELIKQYMKQELGKPGLSETPQ